MATRKTPRRHKTLRSTGIFEPSARRAVFRSLRRRRPVHLVFDSPGKSCFSCMAVSPSRFPLLVLLGCGLCAGLAPPARPAARVLAGRRRRPRCRTSRKTRPRARPSPGTRHRQSDFQTRPSSISCTITSSTAASTSSTTPPSQGTITIARAQRHPHRRRAHHRNRARPQRLHPRPDADNVVKVLGLGKKPRTAGVPIYSDLATAPRHRADRLLPGPAPLPRPAGDCRRPPAVHPADPNPSASPPWKSAGALLITDTARSVRRLVGLISQLDLPASPVTEQFIPLKRADATKAVEFLNSVFEPSPAAPRRPGAGARRRQPASAAPSAASATTVNPPSRPDVGAPPGGCLSLSGDSLIQGRITLTADVRTNRVYVVTSPVNMPARRATARGIRRRHALRHARAAPVALRQRAGTCCPSSCRRSRSRVPTAATAPAAPGASTPARPAARSGNGSFSGNSNSSSSGSSRQHQRQQQQRQRRRVPTSATTDTPGWTPRRPRPPSATPSSSPTSATTPSSCSAARRPRTRCSRCSTNSTCARRRSSSAR